MKNLYSIALLAYCVSFLQANDLSSDKDNNGIHLRAEQFGSRSFKAGSNLSLPNHEIESIATAGRSISWPVLQRKLEIAPQNTEARTYLKNKHQNVNTFEVDTQQGKLKNGLKVPLKANDTPSPLDPFQPAQPLVLDTLDGPIKYPSKLLPNNSNTPTIFHTFNNHSAFLECMWTSQESLQSLVLNSPANVRYVFMTTGEDGYGDAMWMRGQIKSTLSNLLEDNRLKFHQISDIMARMFFVTTPVYELSNYIPALLMEWVCEGHGCTLDQAKFTNTTSSSSLPIILKRLDARYDWVPSPESIPESVSVVLSHDGCSKNPDVAGTVAMVAMDGSCDYYKKLSTMEQSKAIGVIVYAQPGQPVQDMNCLEDECDEAPPSIPATYIPYNEELIKMLESPESSVNVTFHTTPTSNFYMAIDSQGVLAQMGWLLYPSFQFFVWQAEWFNYKTSLLGNITAQKGALVVPVVNASIMQGETGIVQTIKLPKMTEMQKYKKVELEGYLGCPGTKDGICPPWDHIMSLYVCCDNTSVLCGMELGRWITPFRRRIGHWLTNITPLLPLLSGDTCTFTMKLDAWWAEAWKPSLNIRFSDYVKKPDSSDMYPYKIQPLFEGGTFNKSYNSHYKPVTFSVPAQASKVEIVAIITGHGSDENGCGEFCPTSHHFVVNSNQENVKNFSTAGTLFGCSMGKPITGVEPNEHGTWLYGRNGWCNGREVDPWVIDITSQVSYSSYNNVTYFGWYQGTDPDPKMEPGYIVMYSYLVYYKNFS